MKKFLSLVLALVMTMSLVTVSAGAKEFTDDDAITYGEAIEVISTIGVVDGYADGKFNPTNNLTRQAAAKIICNLVLGPTTAASLTADTAPFPDVPVNGDFAGYITYCAQRGIINGYPDGTFKPGNPLTGYAFMKMLLGALGYNAEIEGYIGDNWSVAVAKQAIGIGLAKGLEGDFNGTKTVNREEACLYALNMLQADMVEYGTIINSSVTGNVLNVGTSVARSREWRSSASRVNNIKNDNIIQFAEEYFNKLEKRATTDVFGRPSHTWVYDKEELGTYIDYEKLMTEYTKKVTGKDLYDLIGESRLDECKVKVYIDGVDTNKAPIFGKDDIKRSNDEKVGATGKGVLTQVFLDTDAELITVAIINTYLAKATGDYNEKDEDADFTVFGISNEGTAKAPVYVKDTKEAYDVTTMTIEVEDFAMAEDVKEDDIYLVNVADGEIQIIEAPETLSDVTINGFKKGDWIKTGGTQYDNADTALYDKEVLEEYDKINLKDLTYNVFLDAYGYLIGLEQNEDPDEYVFLTGIDTRNSNIKKGTADGNVIFLDGTMKTVTIDLDKSEGYQNGKSVKGGLATVGGMGRNLSQLNTWCKYRVSNNDVYTLIEVPQATTENVSGSKIMKAGQYAQDVGETNHYDSYNSETNVYEKTINKKHVSLSAANSTARVYGNDNTVYLNLELDNVTVDDNSNNQRTARRIVDDVESVTVGVKNVDLTVRSLSDDGQFIAPDNEIYTLYNDKGYIIAAATLEAENNGTAANYVYVVSDELSYEEYGTAGNNAGGKKGEETWTWGREVLINGEVKDIFEVGEHLEWIGEDDMVQGEWYEVKLDADGFVRKSTALTFLNRANKYIDAVGLVEEAINGSSDTVVVHDTTNVDKVSFENGTMYTEQDNNHGFHVADNVVVVLVLAGKDGDGTDGKTGDWFDSVDVYNGTNGLKQAIRNMNVKDSMDFNKTTVEVSAILEDGSATTIVINDKNAPGTTASGKPSSSDKVPVPTGDLDITRDSNRITANVLFDSNVEDQVEDFLWDEGYAMISFNRSGRNAATVWAAPRNSVGSFMDGWVIFRVTINYFAEVEVEGDDSIYVPCDDQGMWDSTKYDVSDLVSHKNGTHVSVEWSDRDGYTYYTYDNDFFDDDLRWAAENGNKLVGNFTVVPNLVIVGESFMDQDITKYYGSIEVTDGLKYDASEIANETNNYAQYGKTITVTYTLNGDDTTARYKILMIVDGKVAGESAYFGVKDGKVSANFRVGKEDIDGFKVVREDIADPTTYTVKGTIDASAVSADASKAYTFSLGVADPTVGKDGKTYVTLHIRRVKDVEADDKNLTVTVSGAETKVISVSPAASFIKNADGSYTLENSDSLIDHTIRYEVSGINADTELEFTITPVEPVVEA